MCSFWALRERNSLSEVKRSQWVHTGSGAKWGLVPHDHNATSQRGPLSLSNSPSFPSSPVLGHSDLISQGTLRERCVLWHQALTCVECLLLWCKLLLSSWSARQCGWVGGAGKAFWPFWVPWLVPRHACLFPCVALVFQATKNPILGTLKVGWASVSPQWPYISCLTLVSPCVQKLSHFACVHPPSFF